MQQHRSASMFAQPVSKIQQSVAQKFARNNSLHRPEIAGHHRVMLGARPRPMLPHHLRNQCAGQRPLSAAMRGMRACCRARLCARVYGPFITYISIRSTTIGKWRVAKDPIAMHTSWRSNSDIASVTSIGYPRMRASGESSTTKYRLLHASGSHPIPPPNDPKLRGRAVIPHSHLPAAMRRVVNYHSSWARQRHVELFDESSIWVLCQGEWLINTF
ncbi:hypothetical protein F511_33678 [Dorcoceras hygrometricum]|uniref:Uncharacterized protein n=1 Tax=Dorcoceras hygrometricum TaxID=472368 RepID=A0A2Z7A2Z1_9LAMI|nr:hypothetical protein F511_33678 [Dorcoceras hygrometricum]